MEATTFQINKQYLPLNGFYDEYGSILITSKTKCFIKYIVINTNDEHRVKIRNDDAGEYIDAIVDYPLGYRPTKMKYHSMSIDTSMLRAVFDNIKKKDILNKSGIASDNFTYNNQFKLNDEIKNYNRNNYILKKLKQLGNLRKRRIDFDIYTRNWDNLSQLEQVGLTRENHYLYYHIGFLNKYLNLS